MFYLDDIFNFIIGIFGTVINFVFNLKFHIFNGFDISFGVFLISCCVIGLSIRFILKSIGYK